MSVLEHILVDFRGNAQYNQYHSQTNSSKSRSAISVLTEPGTSVLFQAGLDQKRRDSEMQAKLTNRQHPQQISFPQQVSHGYNAVVVDQSDGNQTNNKSTYPACPLPVLAGIKRKSHIVQDE
jgi:hypothetical protein